MSLFNINQVVVSGNLTREPELRHLPSGVAVADFGIAVNESKKVDEEWGDDPSFFDVTVWNWLAEDVSTNLTKGSQATVSGRLKQETWVDKETGGNRSRVKITADKVIYSKERAQRVTVPTEASDLFEGRDEEEPF